MTRTAHSEARIVSGAGCDADGPGLVVADPDAVVALARLVAVRHDELHVRRPAVLPLPVAGAVGVEADEHRARVAGGERGQPVVVGLVVDRDEVPPEVLDAGLLGVVPLLAQPEAHVARRAVELADEAGDDLSSDVSTRHSLWTDVDNWHSKPSRDLGHPNIFSRQMFKCDRPRSRSSRGGHRSRRRLCRGRRPCWSPGRRRGCRALPGPETAVFGCEAPCVPIQKRHTKSIYYEKR
jgi:hypothetical protein